MTVDVDGQTSSLRQFLPVLQRPQVRVEAVTREGGNQLNVEVLALQVGDAGSVPLFGRLERGSVRSSGRRRAQALGTDSAAQLTSASGILLCNVSASAAVDGSTVICVVPGNTSRQILDAIDSDPAGRWQLQVRACTLFECSDFASRPVQALGGRSIPPLGVRAFRLRSEGSLLQVLWLALDRDAEAEALEQAVELREVSVFHVGLGTAGGDMQTSNAVAAAIERREDGWTASVSGHSLVRSVRRWDSRPAWYAVNASTSSGEAVLSLYEEQLQQALASLYSLQGTYRIAIFEAEVQLPRQQWAEGPVSVAVASVPLGGNATQALWTRTSAAIRDSCQASEYLDQQGTLEQQQCRSCPEGGALGTGGQVAQCGG